MESRISTSTTLMGLFGSPVRHSISPRMHNIAFQHWGLDFAYLAFSVTIDTAAQAVAAVRTLQMRGANVTMPCKTAVIPHLDRLTPVAEMANAVNTIINDDGVLTGHNTDGIGYLTMLQQAGVTVAGKSMVIVGTGGATTAICAQAALSGVRSIALFNRQDEFFSQAVTFAKTITEQTNCVVTVHDLAHQELLREMAGARGNAVFLNATGVGMGKLLDQSIVTDPTFFHPEMVVSDLIYHPAETKFLAMAREAGCRTLNGFEMLLLQGAAAFYCWTGKEMPLDLVRAQLTG